MPIDIQKILEAAKDPAKLAEVSRELAQVGAAPQVDQIKMMAGAAAQDEVMQNAAPPPLPQVQQGPQSQAPLAPPSTGQNALIDPNIAVQQQGQQGFNPNIIPNAPSNPTTDLGSLIRGS